MRRRHGSEVRFVVVSMVRDVARTRAFARQYGLSEPLAVTTGNVLVALGAHELPSTFWLDADGRVVASVSEIGRAHV